MKDPSVFIMHIIDSIEKIEDFTNNRTKEHFLEDVQLQDATIRRIEIIGEASKNIPENFKRRLPRPIYTKKANRKWDIR